VSNEERRLGKGLAALLGENLDELTEGGGQTVSVAQIRPNPFQPRATFDDSALTELANSIRENGLLQPIVVRTAGGGFEVVAGERRLRAVESLGWDRVAVVSRQLSDEQMLVVALVENLQRENLSPLEEARGYQQLIGRFGLTQEEVGRHVGRERSTVSNALRLLALPDSVLVLIEKGELSGGHARAILGLPDETSQSRMAQQAAKDGWSVRETERRVRAVRQAGKTGVGRSNRSQLSTDPITRRAELILERGLGTKVRIQSKKDESGEVIIQFHDSEDFLRLAEILVGQHGAAELHG
jgi:ParB family chromosome partitioning protein